MRYERILDLPRPVSRRPKMSALDRAAQFSAFAALVGLDEQMDETARLVDNKIELSEDEGETLNRKLLFLAQKVSENDEYPKVKVICYVPDQHKDGGAYVTRCGEIKRVDDVFCKVIFADGAEVNISDILDLELIE